MRHGLCTPKIHAWNEQEKWLHYHETSADMTATSLNLANELHIMSKRIDGRLKWWMALSRNITSPDNFFIAREGNCRSGHAGGLTPDATRTNSVRKILFQIHGKVQLPSLHYCTPLEFPCTLGNTVQYYCIPKYIRDAFRSVWISVNIKKRSDSRCKCVWFGP